MRKIVTFLMVVGITFPMTVHAEKVLVGLDEQYLTGVSDWRDGMIEEQSFEIELSEFHYPVWFVSYMASGDDNDVKLKIIQQDEFLEELEGYIPDRIDGQVFSSLDAVSFVDYNQDGNTDILIVKTWEDISVSVVYDGKVDDESGRHFCLNKDLSDAMTLNLSEHTISNMLDYCGYRASKDTSIFSDDIPAHFAFSSGAGAWGSGIDLYNDGTFNGHFWDTDMGGSGDGYDSTAYHCECSGRFGNVEKHGDYYYTMTLEEYSTEQEVGTTWISELTEGEYPVRMLNIITDPRGIYPGTIYYLLLPGAPVDELPISSAYPIMGIA